MTSVVGSGPVECNDKNGRMLVVSLEAFEVTQGNVAPRSTWSVAGLTAPDKDVLKALVKALGSSGVILARTPSPVTPAAIVSTRFVVPAATTVKVTVSAVTPSSDNDVSKTAFTVKVEEEATWSGLTTAGLVDAVGTSDEGPLIHVVTTTPPVPNKVPDAAGTWVPNPTAAVKDDANPAATIFTVGARQGTSEGLVKVKATNIDPVAKTFTLTATWTKTVTGAKVGTAAADLAPLAYSIAVAPPLPGRPFRAPAAATTTLAGGGSAPATAVLAAAP